MRHCAGSNDYLIGASRAGHLALPDPSMAATDFSVRWQGQVLARSTGLHTFHVTSDDGARLWVDGKLLVDNWTSHPPTETSGQFVLIGGQKYAVRLEYRQGTSTGIARLEWIYSGTDNSVTSSRATFQVFDLSIPVFPDTELSYFIYPEQLNGTFVSVDLQFAQGTGSLTSYGAVDQFGVRLDPVSQGRGGRLAVGAWTQIRSRFGTLVQNGTVIDRIVVKYDQPENTGPFRGYIDGIVIH